jgi:hypothetical protein
MKRKINSGDRLTVIACYLQVPDWMDGQPCVILSPVLRYDETTSASSAIEDFLIDVCVDGEYEDEDEDYLNDSLNWIGLSIKSVKRNVDKSLKTLKPPYKRWYSELVIIEAEFYSDKDGGLEWKELSRLEIE